MTDDTNPTVTTDEQHEDTPPTSVRKGLRNATTRLTTTDPAADTADLAPVGKRLTTADVVGLGEATHGTREFFELKHRILRHLVVDHGVRAFAMEANLPEAMALHDYVVHGDGDPREALASVHAGCWNVESVLTMVEWLRTFNADRPLDDRVEFYGFAGHHTHGAIERLRDYLDTVDPDVLADVADDLAAVDDEVEPSTEFVDVSEWIAAAERVVPTLRNYLDERRAAYVAVTSERAWARARRYVAVIEQVLTKIEALDGFEGDVRDPTEYLLRLRREGLPGRTMADNVAWIRDHADADTLVVWAHDAHLNRVAFTFPDTDAAAPSLGRHLAERHGDDYYALGFSFARGAFQAMSEDDDGEYTLGECHLDGPLAGTMDETLASLDESLAFVDLHVASADESVADWLDEPRPQFRTGGTYDRDDPREQLVEYVYADAFDGLCFVAETTRARPLDDVGADADRDGEDTADAA